MVESARHPLQVLRLASQRAADGALARVLGEIDLDRPFVPEHHTQLFHTPIYARLSFAQRLRYNQLFGVRINEFIMMLERDVLERVLLPLRSHPRVVAQPHLGACLDFMIEDERRHYAGFVALNRRCLPEVFVGERERYFSELPFVADLTFRALGLIARRLAFPLYVLMALEESSMAMARQMTSGPAGELGALEPHFVAVHRDHMRDESRHVEIQAHLIAACMSDGGRLARGSNSRLFKGLVSRMTRTGARGSGAMVIRRLVEEYPELAPLQGEMVGAIVALNQDPAYQRTLFNRSAMPRAFGVFDQVPEFEDLSLFMPGYDRP